MLDRLLGLLGADTGPAHEQPSEPLAVALLFLELARSDFDFAMVEGDKIRELLSQRYSLSPEQCEELMDRAQAESRAAVSLFDYVKVLNDRLDRGGKRRLMEMLWEVAYADGRLDRYEEHLLHKLAGLLYVPDEDFISAKLSVIEHRQKPGET